MSADAEILEPDDNQALVRQIRNPGVPVTLDELAAQREQAMQILDARIEILETARLRAIRMSHPEDWVLFRSPDGRVTGFLQDSGCERVRDILGISIFDVGQPEKVAASDGQSFAIIITGRGRSALTRQRIDAVEGIRESTEDFCKSLKGVKQELRVRQAARANLDGKIVRELAGLGNVPMQELDRAWTGTEKKSEHCRKGRGFGSAEERLGATREGVPDVPPPTCPFCAPVNGQPVKLVYREGKNGRESFFGCPNFSKHPEQKAIVNATEWVAKQQKAAPAPQAGGGDAAATR